MKIVHLRNQQINISKWDRSIRTAFNGIVYAFSWYLDSVCDGWEALIYGDYEIVMPLTVNKKFGIHYLYQPFFTQQLGVFSNNKLNSDIVGKFIKAVPRKYRFIEIQLNSFNRIPEWLEPHATERITYQLDLVRSYSLLHQNYSTNTKRNIRKAHKNQISVIQGISVNKMIEFCEEHLQPKVEDLSKEHFANLRRLISLSVRYRAAEMFAAYTAENNLCAVGVFLISHAKAVMILSVSSHTGKRQRAMFYLIDYFINRHAQKQLILDFEGSEIEGIARFFRGFGAMECHYHRLRINRLPRFMRFLKQ